MPTPNPLSPSPQAPAESPTRRALRRLARTWKPMDGFTIHVLIGVVWVLFLAGVWFLGR